MIAVSKAMNKNRTIPSVLRNCSPQQLFQHFVTPNFGFLARSLIKNGKTTTLRVVKNTAAINNLDYKSSKKVKIFHKEGRRNYR